MYVILQSKRHRQTLKNFRDMNLRISYTKSCIFAKMPNSQFLVIAIDALL